MEHQANTTPEAVIESVPNEPPIETERKPLKPGKWYGIIALLCGAEGWLAVLCAFLFFLIKPWRSLEIEIELITLWMFLGSCLLLISPLCVIAGIVFGILGRNTQGRVYAYTGLVLSVLYSLLVSLFIAYIILVP